MQQLYLLRRFSSWGFRLAACVALLVSSATLAASLLVGAAIGNAGAQTLSWQPTSRVAQPTSELSPSSQPTESALPESLSSLVPAYTFASSTTVNTLPTTPPRDPQVGADPAFLPTANSLKTTVQHSWHTFKQAFQ